MKTKLLLPQKFKAIGFMILAIAIVILAIPENTFGDSLSVNLGLLSNKNLSVGPNGETNLLLTIRLVLFLLSFIFISFSREKIEDEYIAGLRLSSWMWAIAINYALLLIAILTVYGLDFLNILLYNMFTPLVIFILRFNFLLYVNSKKQSNEE